VKGEKGEMGKVRNRKKKDGKREKGLSGVR
jgi:hypothetical protein